MVLCHVFFADVVVAHKQTMTRHCNCRIIRVIVLYYVQKFSTQRFCKPKGTPFQAKHSLPWLIWICFAIHLMMAALPWGYLVSNQAPSGVQHPQNYWFVGNLASDEWRNTAEGSVGYNETTTTTATTATTTTRTTTTAAGGGPAAGEGVDVDGSGEADANSVVSVNVDGWCVFPNMTGVDTKNDDLTHPNFPTMCTPVSGTKSYMYNQTLGQGVWNYDWSSDPECSGNLTGGDPLRCAKCQEIPNHAVCSASAYATKGCDACLAEDLDLDEWVCYSPGKSTATAFFDDPLAADYVAEENQPHLPHDCGAMVRMEFLCQQCPSGCGPFRNKESMLTYMKEDLATWSEKAAWLVQTINFMGTVTFTVIISLIFLMLYITMSSKSSARQRKAEKFRTERDMERLDKLWILREYNITFEHQAKMSVAGTPAGEEGGRGVQRREGENNVLANSEFKKTQMSLRQAARGSAVTDIGQF